MRAIRLQSVRHARGLMRIYRVFEGVIVAIEPLARMIGYGRLEAPVCRVERAVKGLMFDCRMCGQCVLSSTGMSCPMNCPKNLRNGPCGGSPRGRRLRGRAGRDLCLAQGLGGCAGDDRRRRVRKAVADRPPSFRKLVLAARHARESVCRRSPGTGCAGPLTRSPRRASAMQHALTEDPGAPCERRPGHSSRGRLERVLRAGEFAVTAELAPPDSADPMEVYDRAAVFDGWVDAINATDGSGANCHMSSLGVCALLTRVGYAPVMQISARDRNRIAIQGDVLSAAAMGVTSVLCLTGDGVQCGDQPAAKPVFRPRLHGLAGDHPRHARRVETGLRAAARRGARTVSGRCGKIPLRRRATAGRTGLRTRSPRAPSSCRRSTVSTSPSSSDT